MAKSKNLIVKCAMFPQRNIHKYTWTYDGKTYSHIEQVMTNKRRHSNVVDVDL
jgi:hypothetical protein